MSANLVREVDERAPHSCSVFGLGPHPNMEVARCARPAMRRQRMRSDGPLMLSQWRDRTKRREGAVTDRVVARGVKGIAAGDQESFQTIGDCRARYGDVRSTQCMNPRGVPVNALNEGVRDREMRRIQRGDNNIARLVLSGDASEHDNARTIIDVKAVVIIDEMAAVDG